jgi:hypothetical protein
VRGAFDQLQAGSQRFAPAGRRVPTQRRQRSAGVHEGERPAQVETARVHRDAMAARGDADHAKREAVGARERVLALLQEAREPPADVAETDEYQVQRDRFHINAPRTTEVCTGRIASFHRGAMSRRGRRIPSRSGLRRREHFLAMLRFPAY